MLNSQIIAPVILGNVPHVLSAFFNEPERAYRITLQTISGIVGGGLLFNAARAYDQDDQLPFAINLIGGSFCLSLILIFYKVMPKRRFEDNVQQLQGVETEMSNNVVTLQARITSLEATITELKASNQNLTQQIAGFKQSVSTLQAEREERDKNIASQKEVVVNLNKALTQIKGSSLGLIDLVKKLKIQNPELVDRLDQLAATLSHLETGSAGFSSELGEMEKSIKELGALTETMHEGISATKGLLASLTEPTLQLATSVKEASQVDDDIEKALDNTEEAIKSRFTVKIKQLGEVERKIAEKEKKASYLEGKIQEMTRTLDELSSLVDRMATAAAASHRA